MSNEQTVEYHGATGGWNAMEGVVRIDGKEWNDTAVIETLVRQNTPKVINLEEIERAGLVDGRMVSLVGDAEDGVHREVGPLKVTPFNLPDGCIASYCPEMNPLVPLPDHDRASKTPAAKVVPVRIKT